MWSDHAPIEFNLRSLCNSIRSIDLDNSVSYSTHTFYKWNDDKSTDIRSALEQRLSDLYQCIESFENSNLGIDSCVDRFTQSMMHSIAFAIKLLITAATNLLKLKTKYGLTKNVDTYIYTIVIFYEHKIKIGIRTVGNF